MGGDAIAWSAGGHAGNAATGDGGFGGAGGTWGSNNGDDGFVEGNSIASADAYVDDTSSFNLDIVMGANLQQNAVDMTVVGGNLSSSVTNVGEDDGIA
ncbi:hypothetical protein E0D97_08930 [Oricola cellulosilytica]|uniref:PE-PGRS family protein n=2 Tax=Oricola cellulosilytica TaxID=1429082 RepID=A0A4V2MNR5_9HYPH|nr:hypothetical protein E0D97_08930 [Oricola cellulosilytica]